ncbi:MAG: DinB family protein [Anaerolineae bacterium]|nr:DinB family protein [Anaerolineae bacterium]
MQVTYTKAELEAQLSQIRQAVADSARAISAEHFDRRSGENWSAAEYLAHLILSVKPFAKAMGLPPERMAALFAQADHPSRTYPDLVATYAARLAEGIRAEDMPNVTPVNYRFPEGITDKQIYLIDTWLESNERLLAALAAWTEADLDAYQLPHPAVGMLTLREMCYFTIHHNTLHWRDIQAAGA